MTFRKCVGISVRRFRILARRLSRETRAQDELRFLARLSNTALGFINRIIKTGKFEDSFSAFETARWGRIAGVKRFQNFSSWSAV
jgi:hypothetical protein